MRLKGVYLLIRDYSVGNGQIVYELPSAPHRENAGMAQPGKCPSRLGTQLVSSLICGIDP